MKRLSLIAALVVVFSLSAMAADSKQSEVVFNTWVAIPGGTLPAGSYIFQLADSRGSHHKVAIYDEVSRIQVATVDTIPVDRSMSVSSRDVRGGDVSMMEGHGGFESDAVRAWFRPGARKGEQFVYGEGELTQTAQAVVPAETIGEPAVETAQMAAVQQKTVIEPDVNQPEAMPGEPAPFVEKQQTPVATTEQAPAKPEETQPAEESPASSQELPKTASNLPLFGALGVSALGLAAALRALR
jgi:hypothetical protein